MKLLFQRLYCHGRPLVACALCLIAGMFLRGNPIIQANQPAAKTSPVAVASFEEIRSVAYSAIKKQMGLKRASSVLSPHEADELNADVRTRERRKSRNANRCKMIEQISHHFRESSRLVAEERGIKLVLCRYDEPLEERYHCTFSVPPMTPGSPVWYAEQIDLTNEICLKFSEIFEPAVTKFNYESGRDFDEGE